ncbi:hypothetical protein BH09SUM1_BH09SUM1_04920 [soil metagenome]
MQTPKFILAIFAAVAVSSLAVVIALGATSSRGSSVQSNPRVGDKAPAFAGSTFGKQAITSDDYTGKIIILFFWASWSQPARGDLAEISAIQAEFEPKGVVLIGVSGDTSHNDLKKIEKKSDLKFPTIYREADVILSAYGITTYPTIILIDKSGKIVSRTNAPDIRETLDGLIAASQ